MTVYVSIGNSDDKLTQAEWVEFMGNVEGVCRMHAREIQGVWASFPNRPYQNACFAFEPNEANLHPLRRMLRMSAAMYQQDSIALVEGDVEFLTPHDDA